MPISNNIVNNISILTSSHSPFDDRLYYHFALTLQQNGYNVSIISSSNFSHFSNNIQVVGFNGHLLTRKQKIETFYTRLHNFSPKIIICTEPITIAASIKYRKTNKHTSIIYDVTEWYPSKKNLEPLALYLKPFYAILLFSANLYFSSKVSGFIYGEHYKKWPYKLIFFYKKFIKIGYYPNLNYTQYHKIELSENEICLGFTGRLSSEKGTINFLKVAQQLKEICPYLNIKLKLIGWFINNFDKNEIINYCNTIKNIQIIFIEKQDFLSFSNSLRDIHICFDLRDTDFENQHCLPIKIFYYAACGKPVIYSNLKAIRKEVDISNWGALFNPNNTFEIAQYIRNNYILKPNNYLKHCENARLVAEKNYNWLVLEKPFINFIKAFNYN